MDPYDLKFSQLPDVTKARLLSEAARRGDGRPPDEMFETAAQFNAAVDPPLSFLVDGLLARGQLAVLGGRAKSGKSWLVAQLAQALDTGQPFLGRAVTPGRVLYLPLEDKRARLKRRATLLGWTPASAMFRYKMPRLNGPNGESGPGLQLIDQVARDYDVMLIDTLIATLDGNISENDNTQMAAIINGLSDITRATNCAILLVHHTNKGMSDDVFNLLRGASAIRGAYDVGLMMDRRQGEREAVLHIEARDFESGGLTIRQRDNGSGWDVVGEAQEIQRIRVGRTVIEALEEFEGGATADELTDYLQISRQAVGHQLRLCERDGTIIRIPGTREGGSRGRPKDRWALADSLNGTFAFMQPEWQEGGSPQKVFKNID